uniref:Vitelline protein B (Fragments) n=1 Tax=Fasciola hepatica TaxID=6192 RepID=Q9TXG9_FASHE
RHPHGKFNRHASYDDREKHRGYRKENDYADGQAISNGNMNAYGMFDSYGK